MRIPQPIFAEITTALHRHFGRAPGPLTATPVGGGCISPAARVECATGDVVFLKWSTEGEDGRGGAGSGTLTGLFEAEVQALEALRAADAVRVPTVIARGGQTTSHTWILLEWLEPGRPGPRQWERLGTGLATLHRTRADRYGWPTDNFIGSLPQANAWLDDWAEFWRTRRLEPQLRLAYDAGWFDPTVRARFDALLGHLDQHLAPAAEDGPSLLHGDLWSGNVHTTSDGEPALIDPASYHGHREVDLAMTELFGGFAPSFYHAYHETWPLAPGYDEVRRPIYQLYYLLVHVNLFGAGYVGRTVEALGRVA